MEPVQLTARGPKRSTFHFTSSIFLHAHTFASLAGGGRVAGRRPHLLLTARLGGDQEVPAVATAAQSVAFFTLNESRNTLFVPAACSGLSGTITGAHVHDGAPGGEIRGPTSSGWRNLQVVLATQPSALVAETFGTGPNPFSPALMLAFEARAGVFGQLRVTDVLGRKVARQPGPCGRAPTRCRCPCPASTSLCCR